MKRMLDFFEEMMVAVAFAEEGVDLKRKITSQHLLFPHIEALEIL